MTHLTMESGSHGSGGTRRPSMQDRAKYLGPTGAGWLLLPAIWVVLGFAGLAFIPHSTAQSAGSAAPKVTASPFAGTELGLPAASSVARPADIGGPGAQF